MQSSVAEQESLGSGVVDFGREPDPHLLLPGVFLSQVILGELQGPPFWLLTVKPSIELSSHLTSIGHQVV